MQLHGSFEERRTSTRFGRDYDADFAAVRFRSGEETIAMVLDESLGGLCLVVDRMAGLKVNTEVGIAYAGSLVRAIVKHIRCVGEGRFLVGFSTERLPQGPLA